jgi:hypothetical protein
MRRLREPEKKVDKGEDVSTETVDKTEMEMV